MSDSDWDRSASAWIASQGTEGDWLRCHVLDHALKALLANRGFTNALDVGCGEGRLCRLLRSIGISATGIDPTAELIRRASELDPQGDYLIASAEKLPFAAPKFDLVVSCMSLIDIADYKAAITEMARVLAPGGSLIIANLNSFVTVPTLGEQNDRWVYDANGQRRYFKFDHYLDEAANKESWAGIDIINYHRPVSAYFKALLGEGLCLTHFDEPEPVSGDLDKIDKYRRVPYALLMEWTKPR